MMAFIKKRLSLTITLVLFVFSVMLTTYFVIGAAAVLLQHLGIISFTGHSDPRPTDNPFTPWVPLLILFALCILLGTALTAFFSKKMLNPIRQVIAATHEVAGGNFHVQVDLKGISELEELSSSFNKMTHELSSIETLRRDFVNNFSHEFKTPIVSIRGFAKLLKENSLPESDRQEYLEIIITESQRLADLSTNVLNLSKYEHLEIITEKTHFCLDEQIRRTVLLLEPKWSAKNLTLDLDLATVQYFGNEDLLQQIWLNLLDNAIKFTPPEGEIHLTLNPTAKGLEVVVRDSGIGMDAETKLRLFDQFYQGDPSHAKTGNGLGLALVKRILELCEGQISVLSQRGQGSTFTIVLPYAVK